MAPANHYDHNYNELGLVYTCVYMYTVTMQNG